jgi:hypothetical protein
MIDLAICRTQGRVIVSGNRSLRRVIWYGDMPCGVAHLKLDTNLYSAQLLALIVEIVTLFSIALLLNAQRRLVVVPVDLCWDWVQ